MNDVTQRKVLGFISLCRYTGKNTGILAVCDENFAGGIRAMMSDDEEDLDR